MIWAVAVVALGLGVAAGLAIQGKMLIAAGTIIVACWVAVKIYGTHYHEQS